MSFAFYLMIWNVTAFSYCTFLIIRILKTLDRKAKIYTPQQSAWNVFILCFSRKYVVTEFCEIMKNGFLIF